jgi:hypothetical protein
MNHTSFFLYLKGKDWFTTWLALTDRNPFAPVVGTSFELLPFIDIGGTLSISIHLDELIMVAIYLSVIQVNENEYILIYVNHYCQYKIECYNTNSSCQYVRPTRT